MRGRAKGPGRPSGSFTQHRRVDRLKALLESEPLGLTLEQLASGLRVTDRSIRRYLGELQRDTEIESLPIAPGAAHRWRIKPSERGRAVPLRRAQAYALLATRRALEVLRGSALHVDVDNAFGALEKVAETPLVAHRTGRPQISGEQNLEARFFFLPGAARTYASRGEDLDELFRAVADLRILRYRPRSRAGEPRAERLLFHPYAMVVHKGAIAVIGARGGRETVVLPFDAMTELRASEDERFELPAAFDVDAYVHGEFGVAKPARGRAIVEFEARVADEVRGRKWHPQQRVASSPDGRVRLSIPLADDGALIAWVLAWGDAAHVVEPADLARRVGETLLRAAARYR